jgi:hypothetical protein
MSANALDTEAWLLRGITTSIGGRLTLNRGRLRFTSRDGVLFDVACADIRAMNFPWYYFGGGLTFRAGDARYRISFVRPNGAEYGVARGAAEMGSPLALLLAALKFTDIRVGRGVTRRWRQILGDAASPGLQ